MGRRFLYASTTAYGSHVYESLDHEDFSEVYALTVLANSKKLRILDFSFIKSLYSKLCRGQDASKFVDVHFSLGLLQFYLPIRSRILWFPPSELELTYLSKRYTKKLNRLLPKVDVAVIASDFALDEVKIPPSTKVYLECRSVHKGINFSRPEIELTCPYVDKSEGPGAWERSFEIIKKDLAGLITYSSVSSSSFMSAGVNNHQIHLAPLPIVNIEVIDSQLREPGTLLWVGRGFPSKGLDLAVQIANQLDLELTVVGSLKPNLVKWLRKYPTVQYLGKLSRRQVFELMQRKEILILPTIESYGLAALEGLQNGMKVVTSPYVGINDWLEKFPNLFVSPTFSLTSMKMMVEHALKSKSTNSRPEIPVLELWQEMLAKL